MCEAKPKYARRWPAAFLIAVIVTALAVPAFAGEEGEIDPILITSPTPEDETGSGVDALLQSLKVGLFKILAEGHGGLYGWLFSTLSC